MDQVTDNTEKLRIQVDWEDVPWFRAMPFDPSQTEEVVAEDYSVFSYQLKIDDAVTERLKIICDRIEVLEPQWLGDLLSIGR